MLYIGAVTVTLKLVDYVSGMHLSIRGFNVGFIILPIFMVLKAILSLNLGVYFCNIL